MHITIDSSMFETWPEAALGIVLATNVNNRSARPKFELTRPFATPEAVGQHPNIQAWRKAYRAFGSDPHKYRCSSEALARQVVKGNNIWGINPLVDCYNYISLKYIVPVGGEDLAKVVGDITLKRATGTEPFIRLGGTGNEPPEPGEVIYADAVGALCRRWNWREADRTKLTAETTTAVLVIETIPPMTLAMLQQATDELAALVQQWCQANTQTHILSKLDQTVVL